MFKKKKPIRNQFKNVFCFLQTKTRVNNTDYVENRLNQSQDGINMTVDDRVSDKDKVRRFFINKETFIYN